jgi:hypothetical protein
MPFTPPDKIDGIRLGNRNPIQERGLEALIEAVEFMSQPPTGPLAKDEAINQRKFHSHVPLAGTGFLKVIQAQCHLDGPPVDVQLARDISGALVYRCVHAAAHEWRVDDGLRMK